MNTLKKLPQYIRKLRNRSVSTIARNCTGDFELGTYELFQETVFKHVWRS